MYQTTRLQSIKNKIQLSGPNKINESLTIRLLRVIGSPFVPDSEMHGDDIESLELYELAVKNKISLLYLETLQKRGRLIRLKPQYEEMRRKYTNFSNAFARAARILNNGNIDYAVFKTVRPYPEVPGDIDAVILGDENMYNKATEIFLRSGYKEAISDGPTPTKGDLMDFTENVPIDLQQDLRLSWLNYMDKDKFRGRTIKIKLSSGDEVSVLPPEIDMAAILIHSMMEQLYLLGEYYTINYRLADMTDDAVNSFIDVIGDNKIVQAARCHLSITAALSEASFGIVPEKITDILNRIGVDMSEVSSIIKNDFTIPHRYQLMTVSKVFVDKMGDKKFRYSVLLQILHMLNPKLTWFMINQLIVRRRRKYYIKDYVINKIRFKA